MATQKIGPAVDADGHILEPADLWLKYIDPQYRDRAIRIDHDEKGWEVLLFDNKPAEVVRGTLGALGGVGVPPEPDRPSRWQVACFNFRPKSRASPSSASHHKRGSFATPTENCYALPVAVPFLY